MTLRLRRLPVVLIAYSGGYLPTIYSLEGTRHRILGVLLLDASLASARASRPGFRDPATAPFSSAPLPAPPSRRIPVFAPIWQRRDARMATARRFSRAYGVKARGTLVFTSGQPGWDADLRIQTEDYVGQVEQALKNVVAVLAAAGAEPVHLVRLNWFVMSRDDYLGRAREVGRLYRDLIGHYAVTMSAFQVAALMVDGAKVQLEAIAVVPDA